MTVTGTDVSGDGQYPGLPWPQWYRAGVRFAVLKTSEGRRVDKYFTQHHAQAVAAGLWTWEYHALANGVPGDEQVERFMAQWPRGWRGPGVVDFETDGTADELGDFCDTWDSIAHRPLMIYTSAEKWRQMIGPGAVRFAKYMLWVAGGAGYASPIAFPPSQPVDIPAIWPRWDFWQFTGKGRLPGFNGDIDIDVWRGTWLELGALWLASGEGPLDDQQIITISAEVDKVQAALTDSQRANAQVQASINTIRAALHPTAPGAGKHGMSLLTNQQVINIFAHTVGVGLPVLLAALNPAQEAQLDQHRQDFYAGPALEDMTNLTAAQLAALSVAVGG
jgi:lysozyme